MHELASLPTVTEYLDLESRVNAHEQQHLRLWLRLLSCSNVIEKRNTQPPTHRI